VTAPDGWSFESVLDGGDVRLDPFVHFKPLPPGARVLVASRGAAAATELPAWCRLTGHRLVERKPARAGA
jgi:hypothetical protein